MAKWNIDRQHADIKQHEFEDAVVNKLENLAHADVKLHEDKSYDVYGVGGHFDPVERPQHYGQGEIECIDYIQDFLSFNEYCGYLRGNIAKYLHRWRYKNGLEDLNKARWYMDRLIDLETNR